MIGDRDVCGSTLGQFDRPVVHNLDQRWKARTRRSSIHTGFPLVVEEDEGMEKSSLPIDCMSWAPVLRVNANGGSRLNEYCCCEDDDDDDDASLQYRAWNSLESCQVDSGTETEGPTVSGECALWRLVLQTVVERESQVHADSHPCSFRVDQVLACAARS